MVYLLHMLLTGGWSSSAPILALALSRSISVSNCSKTFPILIPKEIHSNKIKIVKKVKL